MPGYKPNPGYDWNPLRKYRNVRCPCGCERKAKACLGMADVLPDHQVKDIKKYLRTLSSAGLIRASAGDIS